jgi:hypothetical protein
MAELILLSLDRRHLDALYLRARKGDQDASDQIDAIWDAHRDKEIACFLCNAVVAWPVFSLILPELSDNTKVIAVPLCGLCRELRPGQRLHRSLKMLKRMHSARTGKNVTLTWAPMRRHPR